MPRDHARVNLTIWTDPDFRALPPAAQHLYLTLWTAPELTYCGVHDWRPSRLSGLSRGFTGEHIETVAACLEAHHFFVIDRQTEECLIRSWVRFDGLMKQPRMAVSFVNAYASTASQTVRQVLVRELHKIREESPALPCWADARVAEVLDHPSISAKDLPPVSDPFGDDFAPGLDMGLPQTQPKVWGSVCTPPTPAPTPAPNSTPDPPTDVDEEFEDFWTIYPRREGKGAARKAWAKAVKIIPAAELLPIVRYYAVRIHGTERRFIPHPATWLNQERWSDEAATREAEEAGEWFQPFTLPECPPHIADDPEQYSQWVDAQREAWRADGGR